MAPDAANLMQASGPGNRAGRRAVLSAAVACLLALSPARPLAAPSRIISLVPSVTEMLFAMGAGSQVVGVSNFDHYPPEAEQRTRVGGLLDPDFERILALRPDLVIVYGTQTALIQRLTLAGIQVFPYQHSAMADITVTMRAVGVRIGRREAADALASGFERRVADIRRLTSGEKKPRVMVVFEREPGTLRGIYANAGYGFVHDMLDVAGGVDVFGDVGRQSIQVTPEIALARAPEVIIELRSGAEWTAQRIARERDVWKALPSLPAVRTGRLYILADEMMSIPGPRVPDAILTLAKVLHPDIMK